jgi:hypothetical protein
MGWLLCTTAMRLTSLFSISLIARVILSSAVTQGFSGNPAGNGRISSLTFFGPILFNPLVCLSCPDDQIIKIPRIAKQQNDPVAARNYGGPERPRRRYRPGSLPAMFFLVSGFNRPNKAVKIQWFFHKSKSPQRYGLQLVLK